jgi:hypothetical protein
MCKAEVVVKQVERGLVHSKGKSLENAPETSSGPVNHKAAQTPSPWVALASQSDVKIGPLLSQNEVAGRNELT